MRRLARIISPLGFLFLAGLLAISAVAADSVDKISPKPAFRDPVFDGAADPVVIWNPQIKRWWMFYTNRRANVAGLSGVAWVHGTRIGIAESADGGATWKHLGDAEIEMPASIGGAQPTFWAPDVATDMNGVHHMFLTVVPGIFEDWQHPRTMVHLVSRDLRKWANPAPLTLASDRVIDAVVRVLPNGNFRMWYNNERDGKAIYYADSSDLKTWTDRGRCQGVEGMCEGPYVFGWKGHAWMLVDTWKGLGVYRSDDLDLIAWKGQPEKLLDKPGKGTDDGVNGGHPAVVVSGGRAFCFYFTHPGRSGTISPNDPENLELRRSSIQVVELFEKDGRLTCDRDAPLQIVLQPSHPPLSHWEFSIFPKSQ